VSATAQTYRWEELRAPALVEDFGELRARLTARPPSCLRPRRLTDSFHVCPVASVEDVRFDPVGQEVVARVLDREGDAAVLRHPYTSRGSSGSEALLAAFGDASRRPVFVAGTVRLGGSPLLIRPVALVFEERGRRSMVQPWVDEHDELSGRGHGSPWPDATGRAGPEPVPSYPAELLSALGEVYLLGLLHADSRMMGLWRDLHARGGALGHRRLLEPVERLLSSMAARDRRLDWDPRPGADAALELTALVRLAQDVP
jgi:hypothetical protein